MSFKASMAGFLARLCKADRNMAENLQNPPRNTGALDIVRFTKKVRVKNWDIRGFKGVTINGSYPGRGHILMLPGGAYSLEPGKHHRRIAERFALLDHMKVSVFQYPLCPEYTYREDIPPSGTSIRLSLPVPWRRSAYSRSRPHPGRDGAPPGPRPDSTA